MTNAERMSHDRVVRMQGLARAQGAETGTWLAESWMELTNDPNPDPDETCYNGPDDEGLREIHAGNPDEPEDVGNAQTAILNCGLEVTPEMLDLYFSAFVESANAAFESLRKAQVRDVRKARARLKKLAKLAEAAAAVLHDMDPAVQHLEYWVAAATGEESARTKRMRKAFPALDCWK